MRKRGPSFSDQILIIKKVEISIRNDLIDAQSIFQQIVPRTKCSYSQSYGGPLGILVNQNPTDGEAKITK